MRREKVRVHGVTEADRLCENAPYPRNRWARDWRDLDDDVGTIPGWHIMRIGHGTKTTTERTGGVKDDELHQCTAGADALR